MIDISRIPKATLLAALFNNLRSLQRIPTATRIQMTEDHAQELVNIFGRHSNELSFAYIEGHVCRIDISTDHFDPRFYNRDNGDGAAERVIAALRTQYPV
jgi:hypothetical protein